MGDHDSPISIHGGGTLAKAIVSQEQGTLVGPGWYDPLLRTKEACSLRD